MTSSVRHGIFAFSPNQPVFPATSCRKD
jgi:hypothetical protein